MDKKDKQTTSIHWKLVAFFVVIVLFAIACAWVAADQYRDHFSGEITTSHERWGTFGDFFGGTLNPIFSFLSLIALLATLLYQSRELKVSTEELKKSTIALEGQGASLKQQNFETTFFNMVRLHHEILNGLVTSLMGKQCLALLARKITDNISKDLRLLASHGDVENHTWPELSKMLTELFVSEASSLNHYFRNLYRIFLFIDDQAFNIEQKRMYSGILRAQLSQGELLSLFYNGLHEGGQKFKPLIERYALFDNLDLEELPFSDILIPLYGKEAYGSQDLAKPKEVI